MFAKDLIKILQKPPEDTSIGKTVKYFPQYNLVYIEPYWEGKHS